MLDELIKNPTVLGLIHLATSVALLVTALVISSVVHMNKGAKANTAFVVVSAGIIVAALSPGNLALYDFGLADLTAWNDLLMLVSTVLVLVGVVLWRRVVRQMVA